MSLSERFNTSPEKAARIVEKMQKHPDILEEFKGGLKDKTFEFPQKMIKIEGFTAKDLCEKGLNELLAYNFLVYLREFPEAAKIDVRNL